MLHIWRVSFSRCGAQKLVILKGCPGDWQSATCRKHWGGPTLSRSTDREALRWPLTFKFFGCCRSSMTCFLCSSLSRLLLYSSWFSSSVWCCRRIRSMRSFCSVCSCLYSSSRVDSSCRMSMACSISFWVLFLFSSCVQGQEINGEGWMEMGWMEFTAEGWQGMALQTLLIKPTSFWQHNLMRLDEWSLEI